MAIGITVLSTLLIFAQPSSLVFAANNTNRQEPQNDDGCNVGFSGPDCDIPYEPCNDGLRKCFNNSRCVKNNKKDSYTGQYGYHCDCSSAADISSYAGHECEHSATVICGNSFSGAHFCANGGECGSYFLDGSEHTGCHCPEDFEGAHCQYIIGTMDGELLGEVLMPKYGSNFYGFTPESTPKRRASEFAIGVITSVIAAIVILTAIYTYNKRQAVLTAISNDEREYSHRSSPPKVNDTHQLLDRGDGEVI